jgi:hypothetical protein
MRYVLCTPLPGNKKPASGGVLLRSFGFGGLFSFGRRLFRRRIDSSGWRGSDFGLLILGPVFPSHNQTAALQLFQIIGANANRHFAGAGMDQVNAAQVWLLPLFGFVLGVADIKSN